MDKLEMTERSVAEEIGITRMTIAELRKTHLDESDWKFDRGMVRYTKKGRDKIMAALKVAPAEASARPPAEPEPPDPPEDPPRPVRLDPGASWKLLDDPRPWVPAVVENRYKNRRVFVARLDVEPFSLVTVRVRDSEKFIVGMRVPIRAIEMNLYEVACRLPRWPGRW